MSVSSSGARSLTLPQAVAAVLEDALERDASVVVLGENVGRMGGLDGSTMGLQDTFGDRVRDLPIADRGSVGLAVGLALGGHRPVVCLSSTARLPSVLAPLADAGAVAEKGEFGVPLVVRVPYGEEAPGLDQPVGPWLSSLRGVRVLCPADAAMAAGLLRWALQQTRPTVLLEPRGGYTVRRPVDPATVVQPSLRELRAGHHVTVAAWGPGVEVALQAADSLARENLSAEVIDLVSLAPIDREALGARVRATGRLVVVHPGDPALADHVRQTGLDEAFLFLEAPLAAAPAHRDQVASAARAAVTY